MAHHLTKEERDRIAQLSHQHYQQKDIAKRLARSPSTISRELRRNGERGDYFAAQAQEKAERRRSQRTLTRKLDDPGINQAVRHGLTQNWSPEQIAGRTKLDHLDDPRRQVSAPTIYAWIKQDEDREHWESFLRRRGKRPRKRRNKPKREASARIGNRDDVIEQRLRLGDWEGDTILGPPGTGGLATLVDRKSRCTIVVKIQSKDSEHVHQKIKHRLKQLDEERLHSLTLDNGTEFARCGRLEKHLDMQLYLADPGCPYQRGTNENTNGLIRQYFPKGTDFRDVTHQQVREVENLLNQRPRACLGFRTPHEVFHENRPSFDCN